MTAPILQATDLILTTDGGAGVRLVDTVSLSVRPGEAVGLVGESGSGKSLTLRALLGLLPAGVTMTGGSITFEGKDITAGAPTPAEPAAPKHRMRRLRGRHIGMVFQDPMTALNPVMTVGDQIAEGPLVNLGLTRRDARRRVVELMDQVGIPDAAARARAYPHEFSGGMRQRVMIAIALSCSPSMLLCDEPTTALDVTTQDQILQLIGSLQQDNGIAVLFVTHDLAVIAQLCDRVMVMYAGQIVESGDTERVFTRPQHAYTLGLLRSAPDLRIRRDRLGAISGLPPDPAHLPIGCRFGPRCDFAGDRCRVERGFPLETVAGQHLSSCIEHDAVDASVQRDPVISDA